MSAKTIKVQYTTKKLESMPHGDFISWLDNSPLSDRDKELVRLYRKGKSYRELAETFCISESGLAQWKRRVYEKLCLYDYKLQNK